MFLKSYGEYYVYDNTIINELFYSYAVLNLNYYRHDLYHRGKKGESIVRKYSGMRSRMGGGFSLFCIDLANET